MSNGRPSQVATNIMVVPVPLTLRVVAPAAQPHVPTLAGADAVTDVCHARTTPALDTGVHIENMCLAYQPGFPVLTDFTACAAGRRDRRHDDDHISTRSRSRR
jgi:hypothetical protein